MTFYHFYHKYCYGARSAVNTFCLPNRVTKPAAHAFIYTMPLLKFVMSHALLVQNAYAASCN